MNTSDREKLQGIKDFTGLLDYLRDELDWPIQYSDFDDLTFDYEPQELGIDADTAAKIVFIKQLRKLEEGQPWGIFFIEFEPKRLPVVALRRILSRVVVKKRASANSSDRATWAMDDLLFISNFGEGDTRQICFAHFTEDKVAGNLASLNVMGWDGLDTALRIDNTVSLLKKYLCWPENVEDFKRWGDAFSIRHRYVIKTSKDLAMHLANLAKGIRQKVMQAFVIETDKGPLRQLMKSFKDALIHDLKETDFADMYAQTIAYGLLSARVSRQSGALIVDNATDMVPITSSFLKEMMETFLNLGGRKKNDQGPMLDFDELGINDVVITLRNTDMEAVLRDFGDRNPQEDPVIHFYELFLKEYDPLKRIQRGVFYTPRPVVSYIVRSVHELLQTEFGLVDGLADTTTWGEMAKRNPEMKIPAGVSPDQDFVQILDPATGTGTFLVETIGIIYNTLEKKWLAQGLTVERIYALWNDYVPKHLLPRLFGYELLMAPYAIAHMKIGLKLFETGYRFGSDERVRIFLTNALEPAQNFAGTLEFAIPALAHEAKAVNEVKEKQRFTVVIGNPPYLGEAGTGGEWIRNLLRGQEIKQDIGTHSYFAVNGLSLDERNPKWLNDDYVKFIRLSQWLLEKSGSGIHSFISNHGYIDNPTFRGMRNALIDTFNEVRVLDLHGNVKKDEVRSKKDENVFDIEQGVAICFFLKSVGNSNYNQIKVISQSDLWGERAHKYSWLLKHQTSNTHWDEFTAIGPLYLFYPQEEFIVREFQSFPCITDIMPQNSVGITTGRDNLCVSFTQDEAMEKIAEFISENDENILIHQFKISNKSGWNILAAQNKLRKKGRAVISCEIFEYRPFDRRILYNDTAIVGRARAEVMGHLHNMDNIGLCVTRQVNGDFSHVFCVKHQSNDCFLSNSSGERSYVFPMMLTDNNHDLFALDSRWNYSQEAVAILLDHQYQDEKGYSTLLYYIYALLHSCSYRSRYRNQLKVSFPRIPIVLDHKGFNELAILGEGLVNLHLLESSTISIPTSRYIGKNRTVTKPLWTTENGGSVWIDGKGSKGQFKPGTSGFSPVPREVWDFYVGGYQVCEKWLKDRKGRTLSDEDISHYNKIVVALSETIRLMAEIDKVIEAHGGWPGAFTGKDS